MIPKLAKTLALSTLHAASTVSVIAEIVYLTSTIGVDATLAKLCVRRDSLRVAITAIDYSTHEQEEVFAAENTVIQTIVEEEGTAATAIVAGVAVQATPLAIVVNTGGASGTGNMPIHGDASPAPVRRARKITPQQRRARKAVKDNIARLRQEEVARLRGAELWEEAAIIELLPSQPSSAEPGLDTVTNIGPSLIKRVFKWGISWVEWSFPIIASFTSPKAQELAGGSPGQVQPFLVQRDDQGVTSTAVQPQASEQPAAARYAVVFFDMGAALADRNFAFKATATTDNSASDTVTAWNARARCASSLWLSKLFETAQ